jgi:hypothetical protein
MPHWLLLQIATNDFFGNQKFCTVKSIRSDIAMFMYMLRQALSDTVFYEVQFSLLEVEKEIISRHSPANGRVFQWVAPVNGVIAGKLRPYHVAHFSKTFANVTVGIDVYGCKKHNGKCRICSIQLRQKLILNNR